MSAPPLAAHAAHAAGSADAWVSPLVEVERSVQERAKAIALDMHDAVGRDRLRELIAEEVRRWDDDFERGRRSVPLADPDGVADRAWRNLAGYGPLEPLLADDDVWEIEINAPGLLFAGQELVLP